MMKPIHPGKILKKEFMEPHEIGVKQLAREIGINHAQVSRLINGKANISPRIAKRLEIRFKTTFAFWLKLQMDYNFQKLVDKHGKRG